MRKEHKQAKQNLVQAQRELEHTQTCVNNWWSILKRAAQHRRQLAQELEQATAQLTKPLYEYAYSGWGDNKQYKHKGAAKVHQLQSAYTWADEHVQDVYQAIKEAPANLPKVQAEIDRLQNEIDNWEKLETMKAAKPKAVKPRPNIDTVRTLPKSTTGEALLKTLTDWKLSGYVELGNNQNAVVVKVATLKELAILNTIVLDIASVEYPMITGGYVHRPQIIRGHALIVDYFMGQARLLHQQDKQADYRINLQ